MQEQNTDTTILAIYRVFLKGKPDSYQGDERIFSKKIRYWFAEIRLMNNIHPETFLYAAIEASCKQRSVNEKEKPGKVISAS